MEEQVNLTNDTPTDHPPTVVNSSAPTMAASPTPTGASPQPSPGPTDNGFHPQHVWGSIYKALGGGDRTEYRVAGPNEVDASGKPVPEGTTIPTKVAPTKGQIGKAIIASVLYGLASGEQARGPGAGWRSFAAGATGVMGMNDSMDQRRQAQAQADFKNQQESQISKAQIFSTNAAALHNVREAERLQSDTLQGMVDRDSAALESVDPSDIVAQDIPQDQALAGLKAGQYGATTHNVYVTGMTQVRDKDGNPVIDPLTNQPRMEATVSITTDKPVTLSKEDATRYAQYHIPGFSEQNPADGVQVAASKKRGWDQMVHSIENAKGLAMKIGVSPEDFDKALSVPGAAKAFQVFARYSTGDPYADIQKMESAKDKDGPTYGPRTMGILHDAFGGDTSMKYHEKVTREAKEGDPLYKMETDPSQMTGEKLPGAIAILNRVIGDTGASPTDRSRAQKLLVQAQDAARFEGDRQYQKAIQEANAKREVDQKDIDAIAAQLIQPGNLTTIKDISSMRSDQRARIFLAAKNMDPSFDEGKLEMKERYVTQFFKPDGRVQMGLSAANTFVKHIWDLKSFVDSDLSSLARADTAIFGSRAENTALNKFEEVYGGQTYNRLMGYITPVREEYNNALKAGYAPEKEEIQMVGNLFSPAATPKQLVDSAYVALQTITKRVDTTNAAFKRVVGQNVPGIYDQEALDAMHHLGLDSTAAMYEGNNYSTSTSGGSKKQSTQQPTAAPTSSAPPASVLKQNVYTTFKNGETWTLGADGKPQKVSK